MAKPEQRWEDNVPGSWYVDRSCILCSLCSELAPRVFRESDEGDHDMVYHQPASAAELLEAEEARNHCPVEAIGKDGGVLAPPC